MNTEIINEIWIIGNYTRINWFNYTKPKVECYRTFSSLWGFEKVSTSVIREILLASCDAMQVMYKFVLLKKPEVLNTSCCMDYMHLWSWGHDSRVRVPSCASIQFGVLYTRFGVMGFLYLCGHVVLVEEPLAVANIFGWGTEKYYNFRHDDQKVF
jgi:hypothetical protein